MMYTEERMGQPRPFKERMVAPLDVYEFNGPQAPVTVASTDSRSVQNGKRIRNISHSFPSSSIATSGARSQTMNATLPAPTGVVSLSGYGELINQEENWREVDNPDWQLRKTDFLKDENATSSTVPDFVEFWAGSKLEGLLMAQHSTDSMDTIPHSTSKTGFSDLDKSLRIVLSTVPQNLAIYTRSSMLRRLCGELTGLPEFLGTWDMFTCVVNYQAVVRPFLLAFLRKTYQQNWMPDQWKHAMSKDVQTYLDWDIAVVVTQLVAILRDYESYQRFLGCRGADAQRLLDLLQDLLDYDGLNFSAVRPLLLKALLRLSRVSGLHPKCFPLLGLQKVGKQVAAGGFGDIWKGLIRGQSVSVKIMRLFQDADVETVLKEFGREALIWRQLCHPNLLPFFGLYYLESRLCLVSPWMENGNILQFLKNHPVGIERRLSLILDVALGLEYLHGKSVVHGDLKAINVLVTPSRRACITDFGLSSIADAMTLRFTHSTASARGGTARYQSPELFRGESKNHFGSDVYAFACVCYEILTGKVPFHELPNDMAVMFMVAEGKRPSRPPSCSGTTALDSLWTLLQECWRGVSETRPTAAQILDRLLGPLIQATTTQSTTDWDEKFSSKFRRSMQPKVQPLLPSVTQIERMIFGDEVADGKNHLVRSSQGLSRYNTACTDCFPNQPSSVSARKNSLRELQPKRLLEEDLSDYNIDEDPTPSQPVAKKSKVSHEREGN